MRKIIINKELVIFIVLCATVIVEGVVLLPLEIGQIVSISKKISKLKVNVSQIEKEWPRRASYIERAELLKTQMLELETKCIVPQQESTLLSFISSESKNFNVEIKVLRPGPMQDYASVGTGKFSYFPITVDVRGEFHDLARFLDYLQNSKYFFEVTDLNIASYGQLRQVTLVLCGLVRE